MPIFRLQQIETCFPPVEKTSPSGILAVGGDLSPARLLRAYSMGVFPWFGSGDPLLWWAPDPRCVLFPAELHVPSSLIKSVRKKKFSFSLDSRFREVMTMCARVARPDQEGTWITREMIQAYSMLYALGAAHSVEVWQNGHLVGGLYGIALGQVFFGESMFYRVPDASKAAVAWLVSRLCASGFIVVDCQQATEHMKRFGAREIPRNVFTGLLAKHVTTAATGMADLLESRSVQTNAQAASEACSIEALSFAHRPQWRETRLSEPWWSVAAAEGYFM